METTTHNKLGDFIRAHRERTTPASVGLAGGGRRRTPGLRREELAQLCEVSPTWLTWLEQGRPVSASGKMLARLAEVLSLSAAERGYLFSLAARIDPQREVDDAPADDALDAIVAAVGVPAYVLDRQWDAVAWNGAAAGLFRDWLAPSGAAAPNLLRFMFQSAAARALIVDWPERARRLVAEFRADVGQHADDPALRQLIGDVARDSAEFRELWRLQDVVGREGGLRRFQSSAGDALSFNQVTLHLAKRPDLKLVMLLPV